jgi:hypothetical protein
MAAVSAATYYLDWSIMAYGIRCFVALDEDDNIAPLQYRE